MSRAGFWKKFHEKRDVLTRSTLVVRGDDSLDLSAYKVYINRNIHRTGERFAELAPPNSVYSRVEAGVYTVVVLESEVRKANRLESNTLEIQIKDDEQVVIRASWREGRLFLEVER